MVSNMHPRKVEKKAGIMAVFLLSITESLMSVIPANNAVFTGGFGLAAVGVGLAGARKGFATGSLLARRHLLTTLEVTSKDKAYPWVLRWVTEQSRRPGMRSVQHLSVDTAVVESPTGHAQTVFSFSPGPGRHLLRYRRSWVIVERTRENTMLDLSSGKPWEKIQFTTIGRRTEVFQSLLEDAHSMAAKTQEGKLVIYTNWGSEWRPFGHPRARRALNSVILAEGVAERIVADIVDWKDSHDWYAERGIPYRRGYLLHGSPGSGKTSFITALAGWLGYDVCVLNLSDSGLTDDRLALALSVVPKRSIVLLEDIDAAFADREGGELASRNLVTFSGLLNVLDGVASSEERLLFMTTNHIERLDPALIRPGRVDIVEELSYSTPRQRELLFQKFFGDACVSQPELPTLFENRLVEAAGSLQLSVSMAHLQGYFMRHKHDPEQAIRNVAELIYDSRPQQRQSSPSPPAPQQPVPRHRAPLSSADIDRVPFNPQEGWESMITHTGKER